MTTRKARVSRPVNGLVRHPSSYEDYLLLSDRDKLRLMRQTKNTRTPNSVTYMTSTDTKPTSANLPPCDKDGSEGP